MVLARRPSSVPCQPCRITWPKWVKHVTNPCQDRWTIRRTWNFSMTRLARCSGLFESTRTSSRHSNLLCIRACVFLSASLSFLFWTIMSIYICLDVYTYICWNHRIDHGCSICSEICWFKRKDDQRKLEQWKKIARSFWFFELFAERQTSLRIRNQLQILLSEMHWKEAEEEGEKNHFPIFFALSSFSQRQVPLPASVRFSCLPAKWQMVKDVQPTHTYISRFCLCMFRWLAGLIGRQQQQQHVQELMNDNRQK